MDLLSDNDSDSDTGHRIPVPAAASKKANKKADDNQIKINRKFAERFEKQERTKELEKLKHKLEEEGSDEDSDDESEDDDAEALSNELELKIINTINSIRKKDPKIYDKSTVWFQPAPDDSDVEEEEGGGTAVEATRTSDNKKKRYKDVLRQQLLTSGAGGDESDSNEGEQLGGLNRRSTPHNLMYDQEQAQLRKAFLDSVKGVGGSDDDDDEDNEEGGEHAERNILRVKQKSSAEIARDEAALQAALAEMKRLGKKSKKVAAAASSNSDSDSGKDDNEQAATVVDADKFLVDYIANQRWKGGDLEFADHSSDSDNDKMKTGRNKNIYGLDDDEDDEEEVEAMEQFESKYNFRFEELQDSSSSGLADMQVVGHARGGSGGSMRRADDKRKEQRELRKERKEKERRQKEAEMRRLKNLKRQELQERLKKISEIGGLKELGLDETALDEDWDPEKHEAMMREQFDEQYYDENDEEFPSAEEINDWLLDGEEEEEVEDEAVGDLEEEVEEVQDSSSKKKNKSLKQSQSQTSNDSSNNKQSKSNSKKGTNNLLNVDELLDHGSKSGSQVAAGMLDELYQLDYEDIVAGIPCRFKYKTVDAEAYGLSTEDILMAEDDELNQVVSLKKLATYNKKGFSADQMRKIHKKTKRLRSALRQRQKQQEQEAEPEPEAEPELNEEAEQAIGDQEGDGSKKKRRRRKKKAGGGLNDDGDAEEDGKEGAADYTKEPTPEVDQGGKGPDEGEDVVGGEVEVDSGNEPESQEKKKKKKRSGQQREKKVDAKKQRLGLYN